jgi:hypothetical protein
MPREPLTATDAERAFGEFLVAKGILAKAITWNNYIYVGGAIVAVFYEKNPGPSLYRYFHKG